MACIVEGEDPDFNPDEGPGPDMEEGVSPMPEAWLGAVHSKCGRCGRPGQNLIGSPAGANPAPSDADGPKGPQQGLKFSPAPPAGGCLEGDDAAGPRGQQAAEPIEAPPAVQGSAGSGEAAQAAAAELLADAAQPGQVEHQVPAAQSAIKRGQQPADPQALPQEYSQAPGHSPGSQAKQPQPDHQHETGSWAHYTTEAVPDVPLAAKGAAWLQTDRESCQTPTVQQPGVP